MGDIIPVLIFIFDGVIFLADDVLHFDIVDEKIKERAIDLDIGIKASLFKHAEDIFSACHQHALCLDGVDYAIAMLKSISLCDVMAGGEANVVPATAGVVAGEVFAVCAVVVGHLFLSVSASGHSLRAPLILGPAVLDVKEKCQNI